MKNIIVFDTTLRDGEQAPFCSMTESEKIQIAKILESMKVDVIEAGFAAASEGDLKSIQEIGKVIKESSIASLARASKGDIQKAYEAVKYSNKPRIHTFIATSPLHMKYKLKMSKEEVLKRAVEAVKYAKTLVYDVEFSLEDATRSEIPFMVDVIRRVIEEGATTINIPDTVGYLLPFQYQEMIQRIIKEVNPPENVIFSVHCHNDLGMAVANSLGGLQGGARQVECTLLGIGERSGNCAMEEVVMALKTQKVFSNCNVNVDTTKFFMATEALARTIGYEIPRNKAIVGKNSFSHESGIHQHGVLANPETYEIMKPEMVGVMQNQIVLGKHSGKHALKKSLEEMQVSINEEDLERLFLEFKKLCDKKKNIYKEDLRALVFGEKVQRVKLCSYSIQTDNIMPPRAYIELEEGNQKRIYQTTGDGPIEASFLAIDGALKKDFQLKEFKVSAISKDKDALGEAFVTIELEGEQYHGRGCSTDIVEASIYAYLSAINWIYEKGEEIGDYNDAANFTK